jgi:hypothetical protein
VKDALLRHCRTDDTTEDVLARRQVTTLPQNLLSTIIDTSQIL